MIYKEFGHLCDEIIVMSTIWGSNFISIVWDLAISVLYVRSRTPDVAGQTFANI